jgi:hypothetical protein
MGKNNYPPSVTTRELMWRRRTGWDKRALTAPPKWMAGPNRKKGQTSGGHGKRGRPPGRPSALAGPKASSGLVARHKAVLDELQAIQTGIQACLEKMTKAFG